MRAFVLLLATLLLGAVSSDAAFAQAAATGGTQDTATSGMVFPIRPRQPPTPSMAVPNRAYDYFAPPIRLRRLHRHYHHHRR